MLYWSWPNAAENFLLEEEAVAVLKEKLFNLAFLITPNIREAEMLTGMKYQFAADMNKAALKFKELNFRNVLLKSRRFKKR